MVVPCRLHANFLSSKHYITYSGGFRRDPDSFHCARYCSDSKQASRSQLNQVYNFLACKGGLPSKHRLLLCRTEREEQPPASIANAEEPEWTGELTAPRTLPQEKQIVVIGAGPAGSAAALVFARRGFQVNVFEKRPQPEEDQVDIRKSYIIALSQRGVSALMSIGIQIQQQEDAIYLGTCTQRFKGKRRVSPAEPGSVCFDRIELAQLLINEVKKQQPSKVKYHFQHPCEAVDFGKNVVTVGNPNGGSKQVAYDLLIAADGVNSAVRKALEDSVPSFSASVEDSGREYKTYSGLKGELEPPEFKGRKGRSIHLFLGNNSLTSLSCRRNPDGTYSGTLALKSGEFEALESVQEYEELIRTSVRGIPRHWPPEIARQCIYAPTNSNGKRVRCSQMHGPGVLLLGDAAHAVTPIGGQGCNAALEDAAVLQQLILQSEDKLRLLPEKWTEKRHGDAKALVDIESSIYKLVGGRKLGFLDPSFLRIAAHLALGTLLLKLLPWLFKPPMLNKLGSPVPYSDIQKRLNRDATIVLLIFVAAAVFVALKLVRWI